MAIKIRCCKCGCGKFIVIKPCHKYTGIPKYICGHNSKNKKFLEKWNEIKDVVKYCKCGCENKIVIKSYHRRYGIPDYIHTHHNRINPSRFVEKFCECGCGELVKHPERGSRFIYTHYWRNKHPSNETRKKMSKSSPKKRPWRLGFSPDQETRLKISGTLKGNIPWNKGLKGCYSEETLKEMSNSQIEWMVENRDKLRNTSIELAMEEQLKLNNFTYEKQKYIKNVGIVDFFLSDYNLIIECDGDFWHGNKRPKQQQKDSNRDFKAMLYHNYRTIRFWEYEINEDIIGCIKKLKKFIKR